MKKIFITLACILTLTAGYYVLTKPLGVRTALPIVAVAAMEEHYHDAGFLPDFGHCIKVSLKEKDFRHFVEKMDLHAGTNLVDYPQTCDEDWWNPPKLESAAMFEGRGTTQEMGKLAIYKDGVLYYIAWNS